MYVFKNVRIVNNKTTLKKKFNLRTVCDASRKCSRRYITSKLSQAAACDGLIYSVNYNGQNSGTQGHALPLFGD